VRDRRVRAPYIYLRGARASWRGTGASFSSVAVSQLLLGSCVAVLRALCSRALITASGANTHRIFWFAIILTLLVFVPHVGLSLKGRSRWIQLGPVSFQPEEILKFATIAFLSTMYATRLRAVSTLKGGLLPLVGIAGPAALILLLQPNTAGVMMLGAACVGILFAAGGRAIHMGLLLLVGVVAIGRSLHLPARIRAYPDLY
jgi:cell division protein FtsW